MALRFESYAFAQPPFDIYQEIYKRLAIKGDELIVDVGSYDGSFLFWLRQQGHKGNLIGIEPELTNVLPNHPRGHTRFYKTLGKSLPGGNNTVDILTSNFMLYFGEDQQETLREFKRVLKPNGKLVVSTSGDFNKVRQREFEETFARVFDAEPPARMNQRFDSDIAARVLPEHFANVYQGSYRGRMRFKSLLEMNAYYHSLLSMKDFFEPALSEEQVREAFIELVLPIAEREINTLGSFDDFIQRDFFICNDSPVGIWLFDPLSGGRVSIMKHRHDFLGAAEFT